MVGVPLTIPAADRFWTNGGGGIFNVGANWAGGSLPGAADNANFTNNANYLVTWAASITNANAFFNARSGTVTQDIGVSRFWLLTNSYVVGQNASSTAAVTHVSGTLRVTNAAGTARMVIGQSGDGTYTLDGGTVVADLLFVTNNATGSFTNSVFNFNDGALTTLRGSTITQASGFVIGRGSGSVATWNILGGTNTIGIGQASGDTVLGVSSGRGVVVVSGASTLWTNNHGLLIGSNTSVNLLVVTNGAEVRASDATVGFASGAGGNTVAVSGGGSFLGLGGTLTVGSASDTNRVLITLGGVVSNTTAAIGPSLGSSSNLVQVSGSGSAWLNSGSFTIGNSGSGNRLVIDSGGLVSSTGTPIVGNNGDGNSVLVTGAGSLWTNAGNLSIGAIAGTGNSVTVSNGADLRTSGGFIGPIGDGNFVLLTGAGSTWTNAGRVTVGNSGSDNTLTVSNNGVLASGALTIGGSSSSALSNLVMVAGGTLTGAVAGSGMVLTVGSNGQGTLDFNGGTIFADQLFVTNNGASFTNSIFNFNHGTLTILSGSVVTQATSFLIGTVTNQTATLNLLGGTNLVRTTGFFDHTRLGNANNSVARVLVTGMGTFWSNSAGLFVGNVSASNSLTISNGAWVWSRQGSIGSSFPGSNNVVVVTGEGSSWTNQFSLSVGGSAGGDQLLITNGGRVQNANGSISGVNSQAIVSEAGSVWNNNGDLTVGRLSRSGNRLVIASGGLVENDSGILGSDESSNNVAVVTGMGSFWNNGFDLYVGDAGSGNRLVITNGGLVGNDFAVLGNSTSSSSNEAVVTGTNSFWSNRNDLSVGWIGDGNRLVISNGGLVGDFVGRLGVFSSSNNEAVVTGAGSFWSNRSSVYVGENGSGNRLVISNGGTVSAIIVTLGVTTNSGSNRITVAAGNLIVTNGSGTAALDIRRGTNVFNAGLIHVDQLVMNNAAGVFEFNGGTLITRGAFISNGADFVVGDSGTTPAVWDVRDGASDHFLSGSLQVGVGTPLSQLLLTNGALLTNSLDGVLGFNSTDRSNTAFLAGASSRWLMGGDLIVGRNGGFNQLVISNGARVGNDQGSIGLLSAGTNNLAIVTGAGSLWSNRSDLRVGVSGDGNRLVVSNAGTVFAGTNVYVGLNSGALSNLLLISSGGLVTNGGDGVVGFSTGANSNTASLSDANTRWLMGGDLFIGSNGAFNQLVISNGARVGNEAGSIGNGSSSSNNEVLVTGAGSSWSNRNGLTVGGGGSGNRLVISNGGTVFNIDGFIGYSSGAKSNAALVTDTNSIWSNSSALSVGFFGSFNQLVVSNGAGVFDTSGSVGAGFAFSNLAVVTGAGSFWSNRQDLYVGDFGSGNRLVITNGGTVFASNAVYLGFEPSSSNNLLTVGGSGLIVANPVGTAVYDIRRGSNVLNAGTIDVDRLVMTNAAGVFEFNGGTLITRAAFISNGADFVVGTSGTTPAIWDVRAGASNHFLSGDLLVGSNASFNQLLLTNGALLTNSGDGLLGLSSAARSNAVFVSGTSSRWLMGGDLYVGSNGAFNQLVISNGALVGNVFGYVGFNTSSSNNEVIVTGTNSFWSNSSGQRVGRSGSGNRLVISDGGLVGTSFCTIGENPSSSNNEVLVTGVGSFWSNRFNLSVGGFGSGNRLVISNGALVGNNLSFLGAASDNNVALVTGAGSFWSNRFDLSVGQGGSGNQLLITNRGLVGNSDGTIGVGTSSSNNEALVTGAGSFWSNRNSLFVGESGSGNRLIITNGGTVFASNAVYLGFESSSSNNLLTVGGSGLIVTNPSGTGVYDIRRGTNVLNAGLIEVDNLVMTNAAGVFEFNGGTLNVRRTIVANLQPFFVGNGISNATMNLVGSTGTHSFANGLTIRTNAALTGNGTIFGAVTNFGTLSVGSSAGSLRINGNLSLRDSARMAFEIGGLIATNQYDVVAVTNFVEFAGTLSLALINNFLPAPANNFTLVSFGSSSGAFTNAPNGGRVNLTNNLANFAVTYTGTNFVLGDVQYVDSDGDGITDIWALQYFGMNSLPAGTGPGQRFGDADGDGQNNYAEFVASTDPRDSRSLLAITSITRNGSSSNTIQFTCAADKTYQFEFSNDLVTWTPVVGAVLTTISPPSPPVLGVCQWIDNGTLTSGLSVVSRAYRVRVLP